MCMESDGRIREGMSPEMYGVDESFDGSNVMAEDVAPADLDLRDGTFEYEMDPPPEGYYDGDWEDDPWL